MFDFDGTITVPGVYEPTRDMVQHLAKLAKVMPIAFCTGRQLESFEDHGLKALVKEIEPHDLEAFFENLYLIAENGSIGYKFNTDLDEFEEFYRVKWPEAIVPRDELMNALDNRIKGLGSVYYKKHRVVVVMRTDGHTSGDIELINSYSDRIYEVTKEFLGQIVPDYEQYFHIGNSGIGVIVCPADGDKGRGIVEFGRHLAKSRGFGFDEKYSEIMVVGDRPEEGGNDYDFLKGDFGMPFTVGNLAPGVGLPKPVFGADGERIMNDQGSIFLIRQLLP